MADHEDVVTIRYLLTGSVAFVALTKQMLRSAGLLLLVPAAGVYTIVWAILHPGGEMNVGTGCLMLGLGIVFFLGMPFLQTRALMKGLGFGDETTLRVSDSGMELKGGEVKERMKWSGIRRVTEMSQAIVIHLKPAGFWIVPKARVNAEDLEAFRKAVRPHVSGGLIPAKR